MQPFEEGSLFGGRAGRQAIGRSVGWRTYGDSTGEANCTSSSSASVSHDDLSVLLVLSLQLVGERELGGLLLQFGKLIFVFGHLFQRGLDELALHVADRHVELIDLQVAQDDLALQKEHFALQIEPLVKVLFDDVLELLVRGVVDVLLDSAPLGNDPLALGCLPLLFLLQLLGGLFTQQSTELLLPLGSHESLLLCHLETQGPPAMITNPLV